MPFGVQIISNWTLRTLDGRKIVWCSLIEFCSLFHRSFKLCFYVFFLLFMLLYCWQIPVDLFIKHFYIYWTLSPCLALFEANKTDLVSYLRKVPQARTLSSKGWKNSWWLWCVYSTQVLSISNLTPELRPGFFPGLSFEAPSPFQSSWFSTRIHSKPSATRSKPRTYMGLPGHRRHKSSAGGVLRVWRNVHVTHGPLRIGSAPPQAWRREP